MKVVILAGGLGSRLPEYTKTIPKPMVKIKNIPIIVHIMKHYSKYGYKDFIIASGYKSKIIDSIKTTSFEVLRKQEEETGFMENISLNHNKKINFFKLGSKNKWKNILSDEIKDKANELFEADIKYFNYNK